MTTHMLIDARHREETRVAVVKGNRIEEFDFESAERKQIKGNIYLAKVTRVEPSLQAAFIDYGGNRHGFLAFSEIHPDYYQIPKEDRDALLREEAEHAAEEAALRAQHDGADDDDEDHDEDVAEPRDEAESLEDEETVESDGNAAPPARRPRGNAGSDDQVEDLRQRRMSLRRRYKIQDVIRRRQVLLVQVVKEERGNKGAALTTYLSLAGRYCVLMPNTSHGGGISRKISNAADRKRLKTIMSELRLPSSMGCIVRTAGLQRTKTEIKRDFDYLARLWDGIRDTTLASAAPALIHGDSDLIKRAVRDIYNKDIDEVIVEGDDGYRQAREFMKLLMPSHARRVMRYADAVPLFQRYNVEDQLAAMYHPVVQLKSGGYLVINPTEALVSIDINSGRSTREHNIEQTATATNLEAAQEIARQLRLRDMAGLVVIDFIDMDNSSNVRKVEKAMKDALKNDRARIQVGRISSFGLLEMSRQRLRTGVLEASTRQCPHCEGTGLVRTASSAGLSALRMIEDEAARGRGSLLTLRASQEAALYVLNKKRGDIAEIEQRYGVMVEVLSDGEQEGARMSVDAAGPPPAFTPRFEPIPEEDETDILDEIEEEDDEVEAEVEVAVAPRPPRERAPERERAQAADGDGEGGRRRRRRRRGRRGRPAEGEGGEETIAATDDGETPEADAAESDVEAMGEATVDAEPVGPAETGEPRRRRGRRGRRGGRRDAGEQVVHSYEVGGDAPVETLTGAEAEAFAVADEQPVEEADAGDAGPIVTSPPVEAVAAIAAVQEASDTPRKARRRPRAQAPDAAAIASESDSDGGADAAPKPRRTRRKADAEQPVTAESETTAEPAVAEESLPEAPPKRSRRKAAAVPDMITPVADDLAAAPDVLLSAAEPVMALAAANDATAPVLDGIAEADGAGKIDGAVPIDDEAGPAPVVADGSAASEGTEPVDAGDDRSPRRGWWQRTFGD